MSDVYWVDTTGMSVENSVSHKIARLLEQAGGLKLLEEGMRVALKINTPEEGYEYGLRPGFYRTAAQVVNRFTERRTTICDGIKFVDYWRKSGGKTFLTTAKRSGYVSDVLEGSFVINGGFSGDEGNLYPCGLTDSEVGGVEVGTAVCRSDALFVLSHLTLHPLFGLSGALFNGGFECLVGKEKTRLLKGLNPYPFNGAVPSQAELQAFQRRALESHLSVRASMEDRVFYVNYLWDVTPQPEYFPYSDIPVASNLGFLAATDPVALDAASFRLLKESREGECSGASPSPFPGPANFDQVLEEAARLGLGSTEPQITRLS
jgi:uncharacterized Fe-S center protein